MLSKVCEDCKSDISQRGTSAKRCVRCQSAHNKAVRRASAERHRKRVKRERESKQ